MTAVELLAARWRTLWPDADEATVARVYDDLVARYAEPQRAYHTLDHIADCLRHFDAVRHLVAWPAAVALAIWFHDAIYDPRRADNEEQSAQLAEATLRALAGDRPVTAAQDSIGRGRPSVVGRLIRLTSHEDVQITGDGALLCDIDLAILGAPPAAFDAYDDAIRREYAWVPEDIFCRERARVLAGFLARPTIYHTQHFIRSLEQQARANLNAAIQRYEDGTQ